MNLAIDLGNTHSKLAFFEGDDLKEYFGKVPENDLIDLLRLRKPKYSIISSVKTDSEKFAEKIKIFSQVFILNSQLPVPLINLYESPETLGVDRIAAVVGAKVLFPEKACLVIDMGTCITFDFIDEQNQFLGGNISPGMYMRLKAMHHFTAKLPLLEIREDELLPFIGKTTKEAMLNGVSYGIIFETEGVIRFYKEKYTNFATILCGGDAVFFEKKIKEQIFAIPKLTLIGLNRILQYNVDARS